MNRFSIIVVLIVLIVGVSAQVTKTSRRKEINVDVDGDVRRSNNADAGLNLHEVALSDEESALVDSILEKMKKDGATMDMVNRLKSDQADTLYAMTNGMSGPEKISNLQKILAELQALEVLFTDPQRALNVMNEDGLVPPNRLAEYKKNPQLLEEDTRKALYFSFAAMAVALGLL